MRFTEIFVPGGFPRHTYNPRETRNLEAKLREVPDNLCKLATITGHTKSGKTVLVRSVLPPENSIWIDGGVIGQEEDFWAVIINRLSLTQSTDTGTTSDSKSEFGAKGTAGANWFVAKGEATIEGKATTARGTSEKQGRQVSSRITAVEGLRKTLLPIVIDDFHYLSRDLQGSLVRALKPLIFDGLPVVLIAIPHRRYDALKVEKEMTGRLHLMPVPVWTEEELAFIPSRGFALLKAELSPRNVELFSNQAIGSPHLMQDFCRTLCRQISLQTEADGRRIDLADHEVNLVFKDVAETIGRPIFEKLARGPRQRTDRITRRLKSGQEVDIYGLVLHALAHLKPGLSTFEYEELRTAIREVSSTDLPQLHEVARVLKHMANIAASDESSTAVIDFEEEEKKLHVTDPFFAFFLRWGQLSD